MEDLVPGQALQTVARRRRIRETLRNHAARAARKLLPSEVVKRLQQLRQCPRNERLLYLRIRITDALGAKRAQAPDTTRSFVFVCFGNIMRSPMCEALLNRVLSEKATTGVKVTSAGLNATPGKLAHPWAIEAADEFGISLRHHQARLLTREMVEQSGAILAMDYQNKVQLLSRFPEAKHKVFMLSAYGEEKYDEVEIHDPYYLGPEGTRRCYEILRVCVNNLAANITD